MPEEGAEICSGSADGEIWAENAVLAAAEQEGAAPRQGRQLPVIEEHEESADSGAAMSMGKMDPHAPGGMKRIGVGSHPPDNTHVRRGFAHLRRRSGVRGQVGCACS